MTSTRLLGAALTGLLLFSFNANAGIYRWIDENGNVRFGDAIPPKAAKLERHVLDRRGNLRDVLKRQRTVEELEQHRKRLAALATERERRAVQEKYDRYLTTTFSSIDELQQLRDERLEERDAQVLSVEKEGENLRRAIARERVRKSNSALAQQNLLRSFEQELEDVQTKIAEMKRLQQLEFQGLNEDLARYEYLSLKRAMHRGSPIN